MIQYRRAVKVFLRWAQYNNEEADTIEGLDEVVNEFIHEMYETDGCTFSTAKNVVYGTLHYLVGAKDKLTFAMSKKALRGWDRQRPHRAWSPLSWELTCCIACQFASYGRIDLAIATVLAFDCMLRIGELSALRVADISHHELQDRAGIRLRTTKTGDDKFAKIRKPPVRKLLLWWLEQRRGRTFLFDFNADTYRRGFRAVCQTLGMDSTFVPHSLRHGGATELWLETEDLHLVMIYGRWASESSARHYIQDGAALLDRRKFAAHILKAGDLLSADIVAALSLAVLRSGCGLVLAINRKF
jgi:hypothetical protein